MRSYDVIRKIGVFCLTCCCGVALADVEPLELRSDKITVRLGREERGGIVSLKTAEGVELVAAQKTPRLFTLNVSKKADTPGEKVMLSNGVRENEYADV